MTTLREAAQQALEALVAAYQGKDKQGQVIDAITALKAALAEPQTWVCPDSAEHRYQKPGHCEDCGKTLVQVAESPDSTKTVAESEPVAWINNQGDLLRHHPESYGREDENWMPLYTFPFNLNDPAVQKRLAAQWGYVKEEPLMEEKIDELSRTMVKGDKSVNWLCRAIERAHGIGGQE